MTIWLDFGFRENPYAVEPLAASAEGQQLLIGRGDELRRLEHAITSLDLHTTIEGPIGAGKTSLVAVARHSLDNDSNSPFIFDSGSTFQITESDSLRDIERRTAFAVAQFFIRRKDDLQRLGLDIPDTSLIDKWLNLPVFRGAEAGAGGFHAGVSQQSTQSQGFDEAGFSAQVNSWLSECFPTRGTGGIIFALDNLELIESVTDTRRALEQLRDGPFAWQGLRWVLIGSSAVLRFAATSPRLQGYLTEPITVEQLDASEIPEVVRVRVDEFALDDKAFVPVEPEHFPLIYESVKGNLRAALQLCQEFALDIHSSGRYPDSAEKSGLIADFLELKAERYLRGASSLTDRNWRLFDDLVDAGGGLDASQHAEYGFTSADEFRSAADLLESTSLLTRGATTEPEEFSFEITTGGWLVSRLRRSQRERREGIRVDGSGSSDTWEYVPAVRSEPVAEVDRIERDLGYRSPQVAQIVGITYRQLDYWTRTGLITPSLVDAESSNVALYSFTDVVLLKVVKRLLDAGISLKRIRSVLDLIRVNLDTDMPLQDLTVISDGETFHMVRSEEEVVDAFRSGRSVFGIALGPVQDEVEQAIHSLFPDDG